VECVRLGSLAGKVPVPGWTTHKAAAASLVLVTWPCFPTVSISHLFHACYMPCHSRPPGYVQNLANSRFHEAPHCVCFTILLSVAPPPPSAQTFPSAPRTSSVCVLPLRREVSTHTHTQLTPWRYVLYEKPTVAQRVKKTSAFYGTRRFSIEFTRARHWSPSRAS
jgi:hypothetical protein